VEQRIRVLDMKMSGDGDDAWRQDECLQTGTSAPLNERLMYKTPNLEIHSSLDRQIMKLSQHRSDVVCLFVCLSVSVCLCVTLVYSRRPNGWMDQDATWCGLRPRPRRHCVRWDPATPTEKVQQPRTFRPVSIVAKPSPMSASAELLK